MPRANSLYTAEEIARRAKEIYNSQLRSKLEPEFIGKFVSIDVETEDFAVADTGMQASRQLLSNKPDAELFCIRIGYPAIRTFGPRLTKKIR